MVVCLASGYTIFPPQSSDTIALHCHHMMHIQHATVLVCVGSIAALQTSLTFSGMCNTLLPLLDHLHTTSLNVHYPSLQLITSTLSTLIVWLNFGTHSLRLISIFLQCLGIALSNNFFFLSCIISFITYYNCCKTLIIITLQ